MLSNAIWGRCSRWKPERKKPRADDSGGAPLPSEIQSLRRRRTKLLSPSVVTNSKRLADTL
jgi:hypothetical protein